MQENKEKYCTQLFLSMQYNSYCHFDEGEIYLAFVLLISRSLLRRDDIKKLVYETNRHTQLLRLHNYK